MRRLSSIFSIALTVVTLVFAQAAAAQGNSDNAGNNGKGNAFGKHKNIGVSNASDGIKGRIVTDRDIYYTGDPLSIGLKFPRGAEVITGGDADAFVVVFAPNPVATTTGEDALTEPLVLPVNSDVSEEHRNLFSIDAVDIAALPAGTYQLGLILTVPGGDPLNLNDWYRGLLGLEDRVGLTVSDEPLPADEDGDGEVDNDDDDDGFSDDDDDDDDDDDSGDS